MPENKDQIGRVVVITGASDGIGARAARTLGAWRGIGWQSSAPLAGQEKLDGVVAEAAPAGAAIGVRTDVTKRAEVERLRDRAIATFGQVDVWVNNAGRGISRPALELTDERSRRDDGGECGSRRCTACRRSFRTLSSGARGTW